MFIPPCRKDECEICQAEGKAKKRSLKDPNRSVTTCHMDKLAKVKNNSFDGLFGLLLFDHFPKNGDKLKQIY